MSPKPSLRVFLRKDILRNRITAAPLRGGTKPTSKKLVSEERHGLDCLFHEDTNAARERGNGDGESEVDAESLFGEPVCKGKSAGEKRKEELRRFLSESIQSKASVHKAIESPVLRSMRKDLEDLVTKEGERCLQGRGDVRSQKRDLIRRIAALEAEEKRRKVEELKLKLDEISRTLPALGPGEEKTSRATAEKASNAFAGLERIPLKRSRETTENDVDGEERLRMGKTYKRRAVKVTGHWGTALHDYFPDVEGGAGRTIDRDTLTAETKLVNRRGLARLGEVLAKVERKKKLLKAYFGGEGVRL